VKKIVTLLAASLVMPAAAHAAAFVNGSFENGTDPGSSFSTLYAGSTDLTGWSIDSGSIDYIGGYWQAGDGNRSLDMNGNSIASISQTFDTVAGQTYQVDFLLAGNPDGGPTVKTLQVGATGNAAQDYSFDTTGMNRYFMGWTTESYFFQATSNATTLTFTSLTSGDGDYYGPALDGISVTTAVPEAATWAMMIAGSAMAGAFMRRRQTALRFA